MFKIENKIDSVENDKQNYNIASYITSAKKFPLLSKEDEKNIALKALAGDKKSADLLVESNLLLVVKIAHEYRPIFNNLNDLVQEGNIGILRAVKKYNPETGYRFSTYAGWWIRSFMLRYIFNNSHMIKPGTTNDQKKLFYNLRKEQKRLDSLGIDYDSSIIAQNLNVSEKEVIEMDGRLQSDVELDATVSTEDEENKSFLDYMSSPDEQPDVIVEKKDFRKMLKGRLNTFAAKLKNDRQRAIFYRRIYTDEPETLQQIGDSFKISRERSRQIEESILGRLKKYLTTYISEV